MFSAVEVMDLREEEVVVGAGFKGEDRQVKLERLDWNMWRLCAGIVELICIIFDEL